MGIIRLVVAGDERLLTVDIGGLGKGPANAAVAT
jgi:hypothetical protein